MKEVSIVRVLWRHEETHLQRGAALGVTVLICQYNTPKLIRLCLESLLRFYPDIPVLLVDTESTNEAKLYMQWMAATHPNITCWLKLGRRSHGDTMHQAISTRITTPYVLLLDSDTITMRGGWIEAMLQQFAEDKLLLATGATMFVSRKNQACGPAQDESDLLYYPHPACSIYHRAYYMMLAAQEHSLPTQFWDHGAPCIWTLLAGERAGLHTNSLPMGEYVLHLTGASWGEASRCTWPYDYGVMTRPFVTFLLHPMELRVPRQDDRDFAMVYYTAENLGGPYPLASMEVLDTRSVSNDVYGIRFDVRGEYVCRPTCEVCSDFVTQVKLAAIANKAPDILEVSGQTCYRREYWQQAITMRQEGT